MALAACALFAAAVASAVAAARDFDNPASNNTSQQFTPGSVQRDDTPNDAGYDYAEPDDPDSTANGGTVTPSTNIYDEAFGLFGFPSARTQASAVYLAGPNTGKPQVSGFNASGAWKLERGRTDVTVAILDTGIKWDNASLRTQIHLNKGELAVPNHSRSTPVSDSGSVPGGGCSNMASAYDANGDGAFNVLDYVCDSRVSVTWSGRHGPSGTLTAEDLIHALSNGSDGDDNGFVDDIAGWDFFDNDNNPRRIELLRRREPRHRPCRERGRARQRRRRRRSASARTARSCRCASGTHSYPTATRSRSGMLFATDNGVEVIEGANGALYHSAFAEAASQYAYDHGVVQTYSGDDLNTGNHNYPANYGHAMLIQGTVPDTVGLGQERGPSRHRRSRDCAARSPAPVGCPGTSVPASTYFRGANTTQYGGKSSISMEGTTGSENTGKAAGAAAFVVSAARDATPAINAAARRDARDARADRRAGHHRQHGRPRHRPGCQPERPEPTSGRPTSGGAASNLGAAVSLAGSRRDPAGGGDRLPGLVRAANRSERQDHGLARARFATGGIASLEASGAPARRRRHGTRPTRRRLAATVTDFGSIDLEPGRAARCRATFRRPPTPADPTFAPGEPNPFKHEFTVRLMVNGQDDHAGRRPPRAHLGSRPDAFAPASRSASAPAARRRSATPTSNGDNKQELIVPTEDGTIHAYRPNGSELPGWPVHTRTQIAAAGHGSRPAPRPGGRRNAAARAAARRRDDRRPRRRRRARDRSTAAGTHIYAWEPNGKPLPGFPVASNLPVLRASALESQPLVHPKCGFLSSPARRATRGLGQAPRHRRARPRRPPLRVRRHGKPVPGFPVRARRPGVRGRTSR